MKRTWYVYILRCGDGTLYTGVTTHLSRRMAQHAGGKGAKYMRGRGQPRLHHWEAHPTRGAALSREAAIKKLARSAKLALAGDPSIRPASAEDESFIRKTLVRLDLDLERILPEQFFIAMEGRARAGFARIKPYRSCFELGGVVVLEKFRGRGVGGRLVRCLAGRFPTATVWLTTLKRDYFSRFGFEISIPPAELRKKLERLHGGYPGVTAMKADRAEFTRSAAIR